MRTLLLWLVLCTVAYAQPTAKIVGPSEAPAGEMVVLSSTGSVGDNLIWVKPDTLQSLQVGCSLLDQQIVFATTKAGAYEFWLIVADKDAKISYARHTVVVGANPQLPPDEPDKPTDPQPPTDPARWSQLQTISRTGADRVDDATTRAKLKASIAAGILELESRCATGNCPTLSEAKKFILTRIESVLLTRTGQSALVDWTAWRKSNQVELDRLGLVDLNDYLAAAKAIGSGL